MSRLDHFIEGRINNVIRPIEDPKRQNDPRVQAWRAVATDNLKQRLATRRAPQTSPLEEK